MIVINFSFSITEMKNISNELELNKLRLKIKDEMLNYYCNPQDSETDKLMLSMVQISEASILGLKKFQFNYFTLDENEILQSCLQMFMDLNLIQRFQINPKSLCHYLLTLKMNYRNETVEYHNWDHAFNVTQSMFVILNQSGWRNNEFTDVEVLGLLIACLSHDLDHPGTNNTFQIKNQTPLGLLYPTSTLERHHLARTLELLNIPSNGILVNLTPDEFKQCHIIIEKAIIATDLSLYFKQLKEMKDLASNASSSLDILGNPTHKDLVIGATMTTCDLNSSFRPWKVHKKVSYLLANEFWKQGELEKMLGHTEIEHMINPDFKHLFPQKQINFLDNISLVVFEIMVKYHPGLKPIYDQAIRNRNEWAKLL